MGSRGPKHHFWHPVLIKKCQKAKSSEHMESELSSIILSKSSCQKYNAWVPRGPTLSCFWSWCVSEETYKYSKPDCYTLVFSLLNSILVKFTYNNNWKVLFCLVNGPCLIFHILSPNYSLVNAYKLLCCIFIIVFLILI